MSQWGRNSGGETGRGAGRGAFLAGVLAGAVLLALAAYVTARMGLVDLSPLSRDGNAEARLEAQVAELQRELADLRENAVEAAAGDSALAEEVARLRREAQSLREERDALAAGQQGLAEAQAQLRQLREGDIPALERELAARDRKIGELEARLQLAGEATGDLQQRLDKAFNEDIAALRKQIGERDAMLERLDRERTAMERELAQALAEAERAAPLERQVRELREQLAARREEAPGRPELPAGEPEGGQTGSGGAAADESQRPSRDPLKVADAIRQARGLDRISERERDTLAIALIEGACVGTALREAFGRVPAVALRDLIRDLESDC